MDHPFTISRGSQTELEVVHLAVAHEGTIGWGEAVASPSVTGETLAEVEAALSGIDAGTLDPWDIPATLDHHAKLPKGARAGLDLALHDLQGRLDDTPVHEMLQLEAGVGPTAATVTLTDPESARQEAQAWFERGHTTLKVKLGDDPTADLALVEAVAEVLPDELPDRVADLFPGTALWVDANEALDLQDARMLLPKLQELGVDLVEQPLARDHLEETAELARETGMTIFLDESIQGPAHVEALSGLDAPLGVNIKVQKVGGLQPAVACLDAATEHGLRTLVGCFIETGLGIAAGAALYGSVDHADLDGNLFLAHDPFPLPRPRPGWTGTSQGPGLGVVPDPRYVTSPPTS